MVYSPWTDRDLGGIKHITGTQYTDNKYMEKVAQRELCSLLLYKSIYNNPFMPFWKRQTLQRW